jgi:hypothetical protein
VVMRKDFSPEKLLEMIKESWQVMIGAQDADFQLISFDKKMECGFSFLTGAVSIKHAESNYTVLIDCSFPFIYAVLRKCLDIKAQHATEADMFDIVAELCNLFAGMLQYNLGDDYQIGLPSIAKGRAGISEGTKDKLISIVNIQVSKYPVGVYIMKV